MAEAIYLIYVVGCVWAGTIGIVASSDLRRDWTFILALALAWPLFAMFAIVKALR
jgi:hypothetical protein